MFNLKASMVLGVSGAVKTTASVTVEASSHVPGGVVPILDYEDQLASREREFSTPEEKASFIYPANELTISRVPRMATRDLTFSREVWNTEFVVPAAKAPGKRLEGFLRSALARHTREFVTIASRFEAQNGKVLVKKGGPDTGFAPTSSVDDFVAVPSPLDASMLATTTTHAKHKHHRPPKQPSLFSACVLPSGPSDTRPVADLPRHFGLTTAAVQALVHIK